MKKHRVQLDMSERSVAKIAKLRAATEASSNAEVIRRALDIYGAVIDQEGDIFIEEKDGTRARLVLLEKPRGGADAEVDEDRRGHPAVQPEPDDALHADGGSPGAVPADEEGAGDHRRAGERGEDRGGRGREARDPESALPLGVGLMANYPNVLRRPPRDRIVSYLTMRRFLPTPVELIAKNLFLTRGTVKRHLRKLVDECIVLEHECGHHTFREGKGLCYRMMHVPRRRT
jgi:hypothetical protein